MRLVTLAAVAMIFTACASSSRNGTGYPITKQRAVAIASEELRRRGIAISPGWPVTIVENFVYIEYVPKSPIYEVEFHAPGGKLGFPRYTVSIYKFGGAVWNFWDSSHVRSG